jgi:hypothetical protein
MPWFGRWKKGRALLTRLSTVATVRGDFHVHQCLVVAFARACARKKRIISRLASGPRASV